MSGLIRLEKLSKPSVFVVTDNFFPDAKAGAEDYGMPTVRIETVPAAEYYRRRVSIEEVRPVAKAAIDAFIKALTRPLTPEEEKPKPIVKEVFKPVEITAENYELAVEKFNQLFLDNHWGDGLPLLPPTPERVKWMLTGTSRSPDEVIGKVRPKYGIATIEKIAISAVMAGAKPEYLPVIITAMEGLTDKNFDLGHVMTSTGSFNLVILVTGPIAKEINMNSGIGFLGYGWRANDTIGRAVRLCLLNLGHLWPAMNDMALIGRPSSHTFHTFAENEADSPWKPYHVAFGYKSEDSCVTMSTVGSILEYGMTVFGGGAVRPWTAKEILDTMVKHISRDRFQFAAYKPGTFVPLAVPKKHILVLHPELAIELDRLGFTRESFQKWLYGRTSVSYEELRPEEIKAVQARIETGVIPPAFEVPPEVISLYKDNLKPGGKIPLFLRPGDIHCVVTGGIPGYAFGWSHHAPLYAPTAHQTKLIHGATLTKAGR